MDNFRVVIYGGRDFSDFNKLTHYLDRMLSSKMVTHNIIIVSGRAKGADILGEKFANLRGYKVEVHKADWNNIDVVGAVVKSNARGMYNAVAGHMRNDVMADECDVGVGFWNGKSAGTKDMTKRLADRGKPCKVVAY